MNKNEPIRIAQIMGKMENGGVESAIMNYYRNIDKSKIQFDFIVDNDSSIPQKKEIEELGGKVILIPPYQHIFSYIQKLTKIFRENDYKIVHSNINVLSVFPLFCARRAGIPIRIAHSHSTSNKKELKKNIIKNILKPFSKLYANNFFCCTEHAGRWLFGNKFFEKGNVKIINNAISLENFDYNIEVRNKIRKELNIENKFVIGHVGRFMTQKNHERIIEIFNELSKSYKDSVLMLIGNGELQNSIIQKVRDLHLENKVLFLGVKKDVNNYYQAMDVFLFPSLYEGLGMVLIEAQCSGLPCVVSSNVPKTAKVTDILKFVDLNRKNIEWIDGIFSIRYKNVEERKSYINNLVDAKFDIKNESKILQEYYLSLAGENYEC